MESCDEAEKEIIYKSAYKTYIVLNKVIPILLLLTLIANMFLNTGILAVLVVAVIYLVTGMTYIRSCMVSKSEKSLDNVQLAGSIADFLYVNERHQVSSDVFMRENSI